MDSCERLVRFYKTEYGKRARAKFLAAMEASDPNPDMETLGDEENT
jgi:hypothetical protein